MAKVLDFNKAKKSYLTVTLADDKKTTLMIGSPTKQIMDDLTELQTSIDNLEDTDEASTDMLDNLYLACAKVMSRNKGGIKITTDYLAGIFDVEDIVIFFNAYMDFINSIADSKN